MVEVVPIDRHNWRAALEVRVQPERLHWVASRDPVALMILAKSYVRNDFQQWHPLAVMSGETMVGVLAVGVAGEVAWLHHFLIGDGFQGRGHGRSAMVGVAAWLRSQHPSITRLGLCVLPENAVAWALYRSLGFEPIGETLDGQLITVTWLTDMLDPEHGSPVMPG
jgi:diamine N-acetyltransferase